jgi:hypothetical protein
MKTRFALVVVTAITSLSLCGNAHAEVVAYPKKGQSQEQFQRDQFDCHAWAKGQTGVDPSQPVVVAAPPPQQGGAIRGAGRGAALGAIGGAIAGNAGKGAAIGAAVGGTAGAMRQGSQNQATAEATRQAQAQRQADLQRYERAYATCLQGRGYQVNY